MSALVSVLLVTAARADEPRQAERPALSINQAALVEAEREFAVAGLRDGVQKSFLAHFATAALVFAPFATPALAWYQAKPDSPGKLIWAPQYVRVSAAGDLGLSSGPWRFEGEKNGKAIHVDGHFFSIWQRIPSSIGAVSGDAVPRWQVLFDNGISHPAPARPVEATAIVPLALQVDPGEGRPLDKVSMKQRYDALVMADSNLRSRLGRAAMAEAYRGVVLENSLWLREGHIPEQGSISAIAADATKPNDGLGSGPRVAIGLSASGDLGYTLGGSAAARKKGVDARVWQYQAGTGWRLLADLTSAVDNP